MAKETGTIERRSFLGAALAASILPGGHVLASETGAKEAPQTGPDLRDKFFGCIAGCHIGSAMGAAVEGWPYERIERE